MMANLGITTFAQALSQTRRLWLFSSVDDAYPVMAALQRARNLAFRHVPVKSPATYTPVFAQ